MFAAKVKCSDKILRTSMLRDLHHDGSVFVHAAETFEETVDLFIRHQLAAKAEFILIYLELKEFRL